MNIKNPSMDIFFWMTDLWLRKSLWPRQKWCWAYTCQASCMENTDKYLHILKTRWYFLRFPFPSGLAAQSLVWGQNTSREAMSEGPNTWDAGSLKKSVWVQKYSCPGTKIFYSTSKLQALGLGKIDAFNAINSVIFSASHIQKKD